jgi:general secretion pathway protein L
MTLLLITLPTGNSPDAARYDYVLSDDGRSVRSHSRCSVGQLPHNNEAGQENVAVVPGSLLSWHQVQLPAGTLSARVLKESNSPRLRAMLEGLLEDQLLDDPANLHFALQPDARTDAPVWVAVCDRNWLKSALDTLQQAGCSPHRVVPEWAPKTTPSASQPMRVRQPTLWATGTPESGKLVWSDVQGVHIVPMSAAHGVSGNAETIGPADAKLLAEPAVAKLAEQLLRRETTMVTPAKRLLGSAASRWNLAQGELARRNPLFQRWAMSAANLWTAPHWRPARWAMLAIVATQIVGINTWAWHAQTQLDKKRAAIRDTLLTTFPQTTAVVDARLQMERAVAGLRQSTGAASAQDMETMLSAFGSAGTLGRTTVAPTEIDFTLGELRLKGLGLEAEAATTLDRALQASQFSSRLDGDTLVLQSRSAP